MPFAHKKGRVTVFLEKFSDRRCRFGEMIAVTRRNHDGKRSTNGDASSDERATTGCTTCLTVPTGKDSPFLGHAVNIWRRMAERHASAGVTAEVIPACIIRH